MAELTGVSMICTDTTRSRAYVQNLARADLRPERVLLLSQTGSDLPGQSRAPLPDRPDAAERDPLWTAGHFDPNSVLEDDIAVLGAPLGRIPSTNINDPDTIAAVSDLPGHTVIYSGYGGQILRRPVLSTGKRFLHVHGGYLPDFRGSTTNYYSMIEEDTLGASAIFLTEEIDAGPILARRRFTAPPDRTGIDHLHDSAARARVLCDVLAGFAATGDWPRAPIDPAGRGRTYYVIHPVLKHLAIFGPTTGDPR
ncbi:hypothetical protein EU805_15810 [Salipiger sp. IMCC34102]|uniref:formyltransferase family protein n=1 Tax=Salipiger sp. IMCC34102 TaxID=2510647 RepID=UPI00101C1F57|nr:formyltransferase family protein [Salipiger sp. IMCC34102]RYH01063.1 hypothetical protein EU805_15810 [Salipiger sp. IMCC34102]